jgi:cold shock CspA family protein/DNA-binding NarL/FixJ family response regulator
VWRLLDVLFVAKDEDGTIRQWVVGDDEDFGALLARVVPLDGAGLVGASDSQAVSGFDPDDASALAESLPPGTALAFLLVEHGWAQPLFDAIAETGGLLVGEGYLTAETGLVVGAEVAAIEEAAEVIAAAQAAEVNATLEAMAAQARASEAIAASEAIRAATAAEAIRALISAGVVAEGAVHEAVEAVNAAGLIVAVADQAAAEDAAAEAVAQAAAVVRAASISVAEAQVLRYLPTPLSFAVIADKLGISRSAAKDRAERIYHKLGVHSRRRRSARPELWGSSTDHIAAAQGRGGPKRNEARAVKPLRSPTAGGGWVSSKLRLASVETTPPEVTAAGLPSRFPAPSPCVVSRRRFMPAGTVKWFNTTKGYGFIAPDGGGKDIFVHQSAIDAALMDKPLTEGQRVEFESEQAEKGPQARWVRPA